MALCAPTIRSERESGTITRGQREEAMSKEGLRTCAVLVVVAKIDVDSFTELEEACPLVHVQALVRVLLLQELEEGVGQRLAIDKQQADKDLRNFDICIRASPQQAIVREDPGDEKEGRAKERRVAMTHTYTLLLRLLGEIKGEAVDVLEGDRIVKLGTEFGHVLPDFVQRVETAR
jgi:hypothetical protein